MNSQIEAKKRLVKDNLKQKINEQKEKYLGSDSVKADKKIKKKFNGKKRMGGEEKDVEEVSKNKKRLASYGV